MKKPAVSKLARAFSVALAIFTIALGACSGDADSDGQAETPTLELRDSIFYPGAYAAPSETTKLTLEQEQVITDRMDTLVGECLAERGVEPTDVSGADYVDHSPYGVIDRQWAATYGYVTASQVQMLLRGDEGEDPNSSSEPTQVVDPEWDAAYSGVEPEVEVTDDEGRIIGRYRPDGCLPTGTLAVEPNYYQRLDLGSQISDINRTATRTVEESDAYKNAEQKWRTCMADAGYTVGDPMDPGGDADTDPAAITAESIEQALTDVDCKTSTSFLRDWSRLIAEEESRLFQAAPGLLEKFGELSQEALDNASGDG